MNDITHLLNAGQLGEAPSASEWLAVVYEELRKLAVARMASESPGQTLQPTALVHEVWLRLNRGAERRWNDRTHFFASAAEAMRRILVDNARRKLAVRHGGHRQRVEMPELAAAIDETDEKVLAVHEALERFAELDPAKAELVKLRYFVGMTLEQAAEALGISERTAKRQWAFARAWLHEEICTRGRAE